MDSKERMKRDESVKL